MYLCMGFSSRTRLRTIVPPGKTPGQAHHRLSQGDLRGAKLACLQFKAWVSEFLSPTPDKRRRAELGVKACARQADTPT
jgi:hypothetical protein